MYKRQTIGKDEISRQRAICGEIFERINASRAHPLAMVDTYGCQQNEADSEKIRGYLAEMGYYPTVFEKNEKPGGMLRYGIPSYKLEKDVIAAYRKKHKTPPANDDPITTMNMADMQAMMTSTVSTFGTLLGIIAGISLIVGGIGIMNIMLVSVSERTKEIGLRKAIGATKRAVLLQFLIEAIIVSILGGIIGILFGIASSVLLAKIAKWAISISPSSVMMAFGFSAMVGIIFGYLPARKASRLSPIEALRYE